MHNPIKQIYTAISLHRQNRISWLVLSAQVVSLIFSPFYLSVMAFVVLFTFSYLNLLPVITKLLLTFIVYFFTVLLPHLSIFMYRKLNGWTRHEISHRQRRYVPYVLGVSTHAAASAGVVGAIMAFSLIFNFDPTGWLYLSILLCGTVCSARLILRQHSLADLGWGVLVGFLCGFLSIILV